MQAKQSRAPYYIKLHLGDYERDTVELSPLQDGMYFRLMRWYYATGKPIPNDLNRIYRRVHALSVEECDAVRYILENFFVLDGPVWRQKRIDEELQEWSGRSEVAKVNAERRWKKGNENNESAYAKAMPSQCKGNANQNQNQNRIMTSSVSLKPQKSCSVSPNHVSQAKEILNFLNDKTGKRFRPVPANITPIVARLKEGYTDRHFRVVIARKAREWGTDEKMMQYLRPKTLFNATNFANYAADVPEET